LRSAGQFLQVGRSCAVFCMCSHMLRSTPNAGARWRTPRGLLLVIATPRPSRAVPLSTSWFCSFPRSASFRGSSSSVHWPFSLAVSHMVFCWLPHGSVTAMPWSSTRSLHIVLCRPIFASWSQLCFVSHVITHASQRALRRGQVAQTPVPAFGHCNATAISCRAIQHQLVLLVFAQRLPSWVARRKPCRATFGCRAFQRRAVPCCIKG